MNSGSYSPSSLAGDQSISAKDRIEASNKDQVDDQGVSGNHVADGVGASNNDQVANTRLYSVRPRRSLHPQSHLKAHYTGYRNHKAPLVHYTPFHLRFSHEKQRGKFIVREKVERKMMRQKIFLFGDSITEESFSDGGWGASLADLLRRKADIVLRGYSGYNTRWALKVVERVFPAAEEDGGESPAAVTVFFGANDACLPERCSGFQHVPLLEFKQNLRSLVSFLKNRWPQMAIILITPPPIDEEARLRYPYIENTTGLPERTNEVAGKYAKACVEVAEECQVSVIDLWSKMQQIPNWQTECLWDGLHLSRVGNKIVFEEVAKKLKEEGIGAEDLAVDLPLIEDVDPKDPLKAFDEF